MNVVFHLPSRLVRVCCMLTCVLLPLGCPKADAGAGSFGDAKKTADNGMITKPAALPVAAPDFANAVAIVPSYDKASSTLSVTLRIKPDFHAYALGEEVGKPVSLAIDDKNAWHIVGAANVPAGTKKELGDLGTSVILQGDVAMTAKVEGGSGDISGVVTAQVCTDNACDRPKQHTFSVPTT